MAILSSIVAAFFYVRVIRLMYFAEPDGRRAERHEPLDAHRRPPSRIGAAVTLVLGVVPGPVLDLAACAGEFIR